MQLCPTRLPGVYRVDSPAAEDQRGSFRRLWDAAAFAKAGLDFVPVQASLATNIHLHTLRGMHWQAGEAAEQKLVRCLAGEVYDVALDLRPDSPAYLSWHAEKLSAERGQALFLPRGVAHGYLTLSPGAVVDYLIDHPHVPEAARGARWDDGRFAIQWPARPLMIAARDAEWPDYHG